VASVEPDGGDAACWLDHVCDDCGRFVDDPATHVCATQGVDARDAPVSPPTS
jgi:hypothetical protein